MASNDSKRCERSIGAIVKSVNRIMGWRIFFRVGRSASGSCVFDQVCLLGCGVARVVGVKLGLACVRANDVVLDGGGVVEGGAIP